MSVELEKLIQKTYPGSQPAQDQLRPALELLLPSVSARRAVPGTGVEAVIGDRLCKISADNDSATIEVVLSRPVEK